MLIMLSLFRSSIKEEWNFAPMGKALVFISQRSEILDTSWKRSCPPQMEPLLVISIFYLLVMTSCNSPVFQQPIWKFVKFSSWENTHKTFLLSYLFSSPMMRCNPIIKSYLASTILVCPSALKRQSKFVQKTSTKLGSGTLRHFTLGKLSKSQKTSICYRPIITDLPLC